MTTISGDLKENPLWVYRVSNYSDCPSGLSVRKLLKEWKFHRHIRKVLKNKKIKKFFPVQEYSIPLLLNNCYKDRLSVLACDFIITAPTGQGKTLCYVLPIIHNILILKENVLSCLIIVPSRELVKQIYEVFSWFIDTNPKTYDLRGMLLKARVFYGDWSFSKCHHSLLNDPPHIAITTPGCLVDYSVDFDDKHFYSTFSDLKWIVMDEVDTMLNQTFYEWADLVVYLVSRLRKEENNYKMGLPQQILVSATVPLKSHEMEILDLNRPILIRLDEIIYKLPKTLTQNYIMTSKRSRPILLLRLLYHLYKNESGNILVFFSKVENCHKIARFVQIYVHKVGMNMKAFEFTSKMSQKLRNRAIKAYKGDERVCLLCSDVASRGIDLSNTAVVISYDFPQRISTYIHRAGRTARGNNEGKFYIFVSKKDERHFNRFMNQLKIEREGMNRIEPEKIIKDKKSKEIGDLYEEIAQMCERCLDLESKGKVKYHSQIEEWWDTLGLIDNEVEPE